MDLFGNLPNFLLGNSLQRICKASGHGVHREKNCLGFCKETV